MTQQVIVVNQRGPKGPKGKDGENFPGEPGSNGTNGVGVIASEQNVISINGGYTSLKLLYFDATYLANNGDSVEFYTIVNVDSALKEKSIQFNFDANIQSTLSSIEILENVVKVKSRVKYVLIDKDTNAGLAIHEIEHYNEMYQLVAKQFFEESVTINMSYMSHYCEIKGTTSGSGETMTLEYLELNSYKI